MSAQRVLGIHQIILLRNGRTSLVNKLSCPTFDLPGYPLASIAGHEHAHLTPMLHGAYIRIMSPRRSGACTAANLLGSVASRAEAMS